MSIFSLPADKLKIFRREKSREASVEIQRPGKFIVKPKSRGTSSLIPGSSVPAYLKGVGKSFKLSPNTLRIPNYIQNNFLACKNPSKASDLYTQQKISEKKKLPALKNYRYKTPYSIIQEIDEENYEEPQKHLTPDPYKRYQSILTL